MARVAANQDRSEEARARYVYVQHTRVISRKGKTVRCEEIADFRVAPSATATTKQLVHLDGRLLTKGKYVSYDKLPPPTHVTEQEGASKNEKGETIEVNVGDDSMDRDLVEHLRENLTSAPSKDGLGADLFPLTSKAQAEDDFRLLGREPRNGRDTFHLTFTPRDKSDFGWKGDAWIDATSFEPVVIQTELSRKIPLAVRTLLGTNVPGLGFTIVYGPQTGDLWFPVSFGTEFKINVLFFLRREITLSAANRDFEQTHVSSRLLDAGTRSAGTAHEGKP